MGRGSMERHRILPCAALWGLVCLCILFVETSAEEFAVESDVCGRCSTKLEFSEFPYHDVCCSDCSEPTITQERAIAGYCRTGAQLSVQYVDPELTTWVTGVWSSCSCSGSHAIRRRDVSCVLISDTPQLIVEDARCFLLAKPQALEACNNPACGLRQHKGMPVWAALLISLISLVAVAGLALLGYILYKRHYGRDQNHGFVYVMLEGYS